MYVRPGVVEFVFIFGFPANFADKNSHNGTRVRLALIFAGPCRQYETYSANFKCKLCEKCIV